MKRIICLLVAFSAMVSFCAELPFHLPKGAKYKVSKAQMIKATDALKKNLVADTNRLQAIFSAPIMCGPGLWDQVTSSTNSLKRPIADTAVKVPLSGGRVQELPAALLQNHEEAKAFCQALSELLGQAGSITVRSPNEQEFKLFWATIPFNEITEPLLVAATTNHSFICQFSKRNTVFWIDDVKNMHVKR